MKVIKIMMALMFNALIGAALCACIGVNPMYGAVGLNIVGAAIRLPRGVMMEGLYQDIWTGEVIKKFRTEDGSIGWLNKIKDYSGYVRSGSDKEADIIHLTAIGVDPDVLINNTTYPLAIQTRADGDVSVTLDKYQTNPTAITDDELKALSYDKMGVTVELHTEKVNETKYEKAIHSIAPTGDTSKTPVLVTSGAAVSPTDKRLMLKRDDIIALKGKFDAAKISTSGRVLVLCPDHIQDLLLTDQKFADQYYNYTTGKVSNLYGFEIYEYGGCPYYTVATKTKMAYGAVVPATAKQASVAFHASMIAKATGTTKVYLDEPTATMQQALFALRTYFITMPKKQEAIAAIISGIGA